MIYDTIENLSQYKGMSKNVDIAIRYILNNELSELPLGKTVIDGDKVFVNVVEAATIPGEKAVFEMHQNTIDLQLVLDGTELFEVAFGETKITKPYDSTTDTCLLDASTSGAGMLCPGRFVLFQAMEPHKPLIKAQGCDKVKKLIFKIKNDLE